MIQAHRKGRRESLVTGTARREKVGTHPTEEEEEETTVMIVRPHHPLAVEMEVTTPLTETRMTLRAPGARVKPMTIRSPRMNAVAKGRERAARQRDRTTITLETSHPRDPPHPPKDRGRKWPPRRRRKVEGESRRPHGGGTQWSCRQMLSTRALVYERECDTQW